MKPSSIDVIYRLLPDSSLTPDQARDIRARAWAYVFECFARSEKEAGAETNGGEDMKLANNERRGAM
jgi:hypothetical protein